MKATCSQVKIYSKNHFQVINLKEQQIMRENAKKCPKVPTNYSTLNALLYMEIELLKLVLHHLNSLKSRLKKVKNYFLKSQYLKT